MKILLVSPQPSFQKTLFQALLRHNFIVDLAADGEEAWALLQAFRYDLLLLAPSLPELNGLELCSRLRDVGNPIRILLFLEPSDCDGCIQGLNSGADACLYKPVRIPELLAQIHALARRSGGHPRSLLTWGPLSLNPMAQAVTCDGQPLKLNRKEYQILELLLSHPRQMFPRREIGDRLWSLDKSLPSDATIKSHIRSIRRKLERVNVQDLIQTHYGQGYRLNPVYNPGSTHSHNLGSSPEPGMDGITAEMWQALMAANARLQQEVEHRKQVEAQLRRSETLFRNAQRVAQVGCWYLDIETREVYWTEELFLIHGLDPNQPTPTVEEGLSLIYPDDRWIYEDAIRTPALRMEAFEANLRIIRVNDGEIRYLNARGGPIRDSAGKVTQLTGTTLDVTRWIKGECGYRFRQ
jgi:DNA-binding response OmpR family regulator